MHTPAQRHFEIHGLLGEGGFGVVYRATLQSSGGLRTDVAVKFLRDPSSEALDRLEREGRMLANLRHPAILQVVDLVRLGGRVALVTEYVAGVDLADAFDADPPLPPRALVEAIGAVAEALQAAWAPIPTDTSEPDQLVHRDIKPSNIRLGIHGEVKVLDFGVAWSAANHSTRGDSFVGSVPYMAPERLQRDRVRPSGDIYGLGCTLYEGLAHRRLHPGETFPEVLARANLLAFVPARHDAYVRDAIEELDAPEELRDLLGRMLAHDPDDRPQAGEVVVRCDQIAASMTGDRLKIWCRARRWTGAPARDGPLSGQHLREEDPAATYPDAAAISPDPRVTPTANPWAMTAQTVEPERRRLGAWLVGGAATVLLALAAIAGVLRPWEGEPEAQAVAVPGESEVGDHAALAPQPAAASGAVSEAVAPSEHTDLAPEPEAKEEPRPPAPPVRRLVRAVPTPPPEPAPEPVTEPDLGRVIFGGDYRDLRLRGADDIDRGAGELPPGTYVVLGKYLGGHDWAPFDKITVVSGQTVTLVCNEMSGECERTR